MSEDTVLKEGWATKQGGFWKTWKRRWFVLSGKTLEYSKQPGVQSQGKIDLNEVSEIGIAFQCKKGPSLQMVTPERTYLMVLQNENEVNEWIDILRKAKDGTAISKENENQQNSMSNYKILRILHKGVNSVILLVRHIPTNTLRIAKRYSKKFVGEQTEILEKYKTFKETSHPYSVDIFEIIQEGDAIYFICEYFTHSLPGVLNHTPLQNDAAISLFAEIMEGIKQLHENGLYYGDFHIENVMLDENGHVKLTCPGFPMPVSNTQERYLQYINPKALTGGKTDKSYDSYGGAVVLFEMLAGYTPFISTERKALIEEIKNPIIFPPQIVKVQRNMLTELLDTSDKEKKEGENKDEAISKLELPPKDQPMLVTKMFKTESSFKNSWMDEEFDNDNMLLSFADDSALMMTF